MREFEKIAILGGGLLGGSLALALRGRGDVSLWARRSESVAEARELGIGGATGELAVALRGADLVVLCVPVGAMPDLLVRALDAGLSRKALVTDVGSVKEAVHRDLGEVLGNEGPAFIGSHPMAGSERQGVVAAQRDLFAGAVCFVTDDGAIGDPHLAMLEALWAGLGCRVVKLGARDHDAIVARISHFPHAMAAAAARVGLEKPDDGQYGGGGLRDTTRVAGGDPVMWAEILMENRMAVGELVARSMEDLGVLREALESGDEPAIREWLEAARDLHSRSPSSRDGNHRKS